MSFDFVFQNAVRLHEQGKLDEAEAVYRRLLEINPEHTDLLHLLGMIAMRKNRSIRQSSCYTKPSVCRRERTLMNLRWRRRCRTPATPKKLWNITGPSWRETTRTRKHTTTWALSTGLKGIRPKRGVCFKKRSKCVRILRRPM